MNPQTVRVSLLDALREFAGLLGTKKGCNQGACGACTVLVDGERINSCFALAVQYPGREKWSPNSAPLARENTLKFNFQSLSHITAHQTDTTMVEVRV